MRQPLAGVRGELLGKGLEKAKESLQYRAAADVLVSSRSIGSEATGSCGITTVGQLTQGALWAGAPHLYQHSGVSIVEVPGHGKAVVYTVEEGSEFTHASKVGIIAGHPGRWGGFVYTGSAMDFPEEAVYERFGPELITPDTCKALCGDGALSVEALFGPADADALGPEGCQWLLRHIFGYNKGGAHDRPVPEEYQPVWRRALAKTLEANKANAGMHAWAKMVAKMHGETWVWPAGMFHILPNRMVTAIIAMVEKGWHPIVPMWQTTDGYVFNGDWDRPCGGGNVPQASPVAQKFLSGYVAGFTCHLNTGVYKEVMFRQIPTLWEKQFMKVCNLLAEEEAPTLPPPTPENYIRTIDALTAETRMLTDALKGVPLLVRGVYGENAFHWVRAGNGRVVAEFIGRTKRKATALSKLGPAHTTILEQMPILERSLKCPQRITVRPVAQTTA